MIVNTTHFGPLVVQESSQIEFPEGLPGFEQCRRFVPVRHGNSPGLIFLQSLEQPQLCFITVPMATLWPDYDLALSGEERELLGMDASEKTELGSSVAVLAIISFVEGQEPTANLAAPLVIRVATRRAVQAIRQDGRYQVQAKLPSREPVCS
jgi:flagellar assembly factor FliW